jgi:regulator of RNase E activity RraB
MMVMAEKKKTIEEIISDHEARNASLRHVFLEEKADLTEPRKIECHFWTWNRRDATELGESLKSRGFEILAQRQAAITGDPGRWNLEAAVRQSIDLTMRREFTDELVRLADSHGGLYDGWGTSI